MSKEKTKSNSYNKVAYFSSIVVIAICILTILVSAIIYIKVSIRSDGKVGAEGEGEENQSNFAKKKTADEQASQINNENTQLNGDSTLNLADKNNQNRSQLVDTSAIDTPNRDNRAPMPAPNPKPTPVKPVPNPQPTIDNQIPKPKPVINNNDPKPSPTPDKQAPKPMPVKPQPSNNNTAPKPAPNKDLGPKKNDDEMY